MFKCGLPTFCILFTAFSLTNAAAEQHPLSTLEMSAQAGRVLVMHTDPQQPKNMLAGTAHGGLWRSTDGGQAWQIADEAMQSLPVTAIAADPLSPEMLYAGTGDGRSTGSASGGRGLFKSSDGGSSWRALPLSDPQRVGEKWSHVHSISVNTAGVVLAATSDKRRNGYVFRSTDGGDTWGLLPVYDGSKVGKHNLIHKVRFDPADASAAIFMDDYANLTYSSDAGASWGVVRKSSSTCK